MSRHPGVPEPIAARQTYHSHLQDQLRAQEFLENNNFHQMGQMQQSPAALGPFQQMGQNRMIPHRQNNRNIREVSHQPPVSTANPLSQHNYQHSQSNMNPFQQRTQQGDNPSVDRVFAPNINRQASGYGNHAPVSHIQSFNSRQLMQPRLPNHSSQRMGQARHGSGPSALNHSAGYEEPHVPLFPERNSWEPPITNIIRGGANNRRQISVSQMQQFEAQQQANAGISPQAFTHNPAAPNQFNDWYTTPIDPFSPTSFRHEANSDQFSQSMMANPFAPPPGQTSFTHTPKDRDGFDIPFK